MATQKYAKSWIPKDVTRTSRRLSHHARFSLLWDKTCLVFKVIFCCFLFHLVKIILTDIEVHNFRRDIAGNNLRTHASTRKCDRLKISNFQIYSIDICDMLPMGYKKRRVQMPRNNCENLKLIGLRWKAGECRTGMRSEAL